MAQGIVLRQQEGWGHKARTARCAQFIVRPAEATASQRGHHSLWGQGATVPPGPAGAQWDNAGLCVAGQSLATGRPNLRVMGGGRGYEALSPQSL